MRKLFFCILILITNIVFAQDTTFILAHINEALMPIERGEKYEDPLFDFLEASGIGEVTGGGTSLDKSGKVEWVGVDIELVNAQENIPLVIKELKRLGAPEGSFLEYSFGEKRVQVPIE
ncbi:hypothetical protein [Saccharophagus degradans]|uniref:Uncharacterized protein n=1 Tax=Saccharophagus degradans TaxID=86304 RepID=A0AAW7X600_9GAMM|nr:hypothetical protein [Saccharophagus degradans]MDO6422303.1 hypothetical protein [Saccharophagus degradans]MDO6609814.1 hypothetical protein [Saccharophagus degradans]